MIHSSIKQFFKLQPSGGLFLFAASILAIFTANSHLSKTYQNFLSFSLPLDLASLLIHKSMDVKSWIDDGLMAIFFLLVGLELKREIVIGELSSKVKIVLPFCAAIAGVILPILIYFLVNIGESQNLAGAAIPAATDIAFAVAALSLFDNKISNSLKIFLVALAVIDDLMAILIIAIFYSHSIDLHYLGYAFLTVLLLFGFNRFGITKLLPYLLIAPFLWLFVLKSGIHPTISGVVLAFLIPIKNSSKNISPLQSLEHFLYFPVTYLILPIFAFANSGMVLHNLSFSVFTNKIVLGIILGLFFGKQIGIFLSVYLLDKFKVCPFFKGTNWLELYGVAVIAGIGFTMSLFIGNLAFLDQPDLIEQVRVGVIFGSLLSAAFGVFILWIATGISKPR